MNKKYTGNSKKVALGGILLGLTEVMLFAAAILPSARISAYVLSSLFISVIIMELGIGRAWLFYGTTVILSFIIIPDKIRLIPYIVFFGNYGIIKFLIERMNKTLTGYIFKAVYYNAAFFILLLSAREIFALPSAPGGANYSLWLIIIVFQMLFAVYDFIYSRFIAYYRMNIRRILKI